MSILTDEQNTGNYEFTSAKGFEPEFINTSNFVQTENRGFTQTLKKEAIFQELFESLSVMFYIENFDPVYELEYISPAFESLGYTLDEIYADPKILDRVMHPDDLLMMKEENRQIYDGRVKESNYSYRVFTKSGEMRWWKDQGRPIFNERGERIKWFGVIHDITERKKTIEQLRESNEKLEKSTIDLASAKDFAENILVSMADMLIVVNDDGIIRQVNDSTLKLLGYQESDLIGRHVRILTRTDSFLTEREFEHMVQTGKMVEVEKDFVHKNGLKFRVSISSSILQGRKSAAVIVAKDISKRIEDESRLREYAARLEESNREFGDLMRSYIRKVEDLEQSQIKLTRTRDFTENIMNSMMDFVVVLDLDFTITRLNPAALRLTGYDEHELIGQSVNKLAVERPLTKRRLNALRRRGGTSSLIKLNRCKDGSLIPVTLSMVILKDEKGEECGIVCVGKDVSEIMQVRNDLEKSNDKLRQSNRELEDFAYVASHDLQEPLRKIQAFGDRLQRKCAGQLNDEGKDYITRMRGAAGRMQILINDLLTFSRVSSRAKPFKAVDVNEVAREVVSDLEVRIEQTKGIVEIEDLPVIDADPVQLRQLMQNLIGNALKFHRPGEPPVIKVYAEMPTPTGSYKIVGDEVQTSGSGGKVCNIIVRDNGIGFEEKYLEKIFTVFQRLHGRAEYEGSGIGLAVCRKIAERHGGAITAQSVPNKGSTFIVTLPLTQNLEEKNINE